MLPDGRHPVRITTVDPDRHRITVDLIQFYWGEDAIREAAKDHQESPPPTTTTSATSTLGSAPSP